MDVLKKEDLNILLGPDYVPEGEYNVRLCDMDLNLAKDNDHYYMLVLFEVLGGSFDGRKIKQIWTFRRGQEQRTMDRINNFLSKVTREGIEVNNETICSVYDKIRYHLLNEKFLVRLIKKVDSRSELLYAENFLF